MIFKIQMKKILMMIRLTKSKSINIKFKKNKNQKRKVLAVEALMERLNNKNKRGLILIAKKMTF